MWKKGGSFSLWWTVFLWFSIKSLVTKVWILSSFIEVWYGKTRVKCYEWQVASYEIRVESLKAWVEGLKVRVQIQKCEFKSTSYKF